MKPDCSAAVQELAEAYCLNRLTREQHQAFEAHCSGCLECAEALRRVREFLTMVRSAARSLMLTETESESVSAVQTVGLFALWAGGG